MLFPSSTCCCDDGGEGNQTSLEQFVPETSFQPDPTYGGFDDLSWGEPTMEEILSLSHSSEARRRDSTAAAATRRSNRSNTPELSDSLGGSPRKVHVQFCETDDNGMRSSTSLWSRTSSEFAVDHRTGEKMSRLTASSKASSRASSRSNSSLGSSMRITTTKTLQRLGELFMAGGAVEGLDSRVVNMLTFSGLAELRGSPVSTILRGMGRIFKNSEGSAKTYDLSCKVEQIDAFISHNWSVPRHKKHLALAVHFNLPVAAIAGVLLQLGLIFAGIFLPLPSVSGDSGSGPHGFLARLCIVPFFLLVLIMGRDLCAYLPSRESVLFLDKTCIPQDDKEQQMEGIRKLGAFLCHSKTMVILYTDIYLQRLWTVYEVASFLSLHDPSRMKVIPTFRPAVLVIGLALMYMSALTELALQAQIGDNALTHLIPFTFWLGVGAAFRGLAVDTSNIQQRLENFKVQDCQVFNEDDRPLIYHNIQLLMRATNSSSKNSGLSSSLEAFNTLVREDLALALSAGMGRFVLRYRDFFMLSTAFLLPRYCDSWVDNLQGESSVGKKIWHAAVHFCCTMVLVCSLLPLSLAMLYHLQTKLLSLRGWLQFLWVSGTTLLIAAAVSLFLMGSVRVESFVVEEESIGSILIFAAGMMVLLALADGIFHRMIWSERSKMLERSTMRASLNEAPTAEVDVAHSGSSPHEDVLPTIQEIAGEEVSLSAPLAGRFRPPTPRGNPGQLEDVITESDTASSSRRTHPQERDWEDENRKLQESLHALREIVDHLPHVGNPARSEVGADSDFDDINVDVGIDKAQEMFGFSEPEAVLHFEEDVCVLRV